MAPAWLINPASNESSKWAIHIHGLGSTRAATLRGVPVASQLGLTSLVVTYRNDGDDPIVGSGRCELGASEVADVRYAIEFAREKGVQRFILFGWSMGAAIALQLSAAPDLKGIVVSLVLESPVLDWVATIRANCVKVGAPPWASTIAHPWLENRYLARVIGLSAAVDLRRFVWMARRNELDISTLVLNGSRVASVPLTASTRLRNFRPDCVRLEIFNADLSMTWKSDPERWRAVVSAWLGAVKDSMSDS